MKPRLFQIKKEREMNAGVLASIEEMRSHFYSNYDLPPAERLKAEMLFADIKRACRECRSRKEFEEMFYHRTLSRDLYRMMLDFSFYIRPSDNTDH
jgi:hypothetical protein